MKPFLTCLTIWLLAASGVGQSSGTMADAPRRAAIEGLVTKEPGSEPVKKALVELIAENQAQGGDYTAVSGPDGAFRIENILPGRYRLFVERTGLLETDKSRQRSEGRVLALSAGQELKNVNVRLQAAAVLRGRVTDEDGDPLPNAEVTVLRQTFVSGRRHWEQAGAERTNDLGEYRVANLPAGNVYVSVSPPPDFKSLIEAGGAGAESRNSASASTSYQTTYYPGTSDRSEAMPLQLHAGDEFPINFSMTRAPSLSIQGSVVNLPPRSSATIMLQSRDFRLVLNGAEMHKDGSFVIRDVSPGNYEIVATVDGSAVPMMARQPLQVGSSNVEGLRLSPQPGGSVRGHLRVEGKNGAPLKPDFERTFLLLESTEADDDEGVLGGGKFTNLAHVAPDGSFAWGDVPPGNYYVQIVRDAGANDDWFVKTLLAGGRDISDSGINVSGGMPALELVASTNGGVADGVITDPQGQPVANAVVVAVPEPRMRARIDRYRKTQSDQNGHFQLQGLRPGDYTVLAWESVDGEEYYNPDFVKAYAGQGTALRISEGERKTLSLEAIPVPTPDPAE
jgi:Carboxypeptidase regulatory-like domain